MNTLERYVRSIPDFPEKGIIFRDITTVLGDKEGFHLAIDEYMKLLEPYDFDVIAALEARGFMFAAPLSYLLDKPFVPIRKSGKLPWNTISEEYDLEYGKAKIEIHTDAISKGQRVVIIDDLLATGGTVQAAARLVERLGGEVTACVFLMELKGLDGRSRLKGYPVESVISYPGK